MTSTESFYGGAKYPLDPSYASPMGYGIAFSGISQGADARTANQIKQISEHLNSGVKNIEVQGTSPEVMDAIPKEHFKEMNRIAKLTGAELSMHAPMIDPTGITQHGWDKMNQDSAEAQLWDAIEKSHDLNPKGNIPVTMHATTVGLPAAEVKVKEGEEEKIKSILLVTPDGKLHQVKEEKKYFPQAGEEFTGKKIPFEKDKIIQEENEKVWTSQVDNLNYASSFASDRTRDIERMPKRVEQNYQENLAMAKMQKRSEFEERIRKGEQITPEIEKQELEEVQQELEQQKQKELQQVEKEKQRILPHAALYARNAYNNIKEKFDLIYEDSEGTDRELLDEFAREIAPQIQNFKNIQNDEEKLKQFTQTIEHGVTALSKLKNVKMLKPLRDFAVEKSAETTANLALKSFKKFGDSAPIVSLENHPAQQSLLTTGQDLRDVIKKARSEFVKKAVKEGISESEAKEQSKKLIGATWDVGHINMLRRYGYDKSDIIKETEKVAPYVKHVHLSDNFGFEHTELPMGMGNVPMKQIMAKLDKEGFKEKKVIEAFQWWQHFSEQGKIRPLVPTIQAMGAGVYTAQAAPSWNQYAGVMGGYFGGYGTINPEIHHSLYNAGFTSLPQELGGQIAGKESRMTGTPMS